MKYKLGLGPGVQEDDIGHIANKRSRTIPIAGLRSGQNLHQVQVCDLAMSCPAQFLWGPVHSKDIDKADSNLSKTILRHRPPYCF